MISKPQTFTLIFLLIWSGGFFLLLLAASQDDPVSRAIVLMALGLLLVWVTLAGGLMWQYRELLIEAVMRFRIDWRIRFVILATLLALLEEAIATLMTNLAPLFGDPTYTAAITASRNYFEVVSSHSVIVFIPMFIAWAFLLGWRSFSPFSVMVLFGISGLLAEVLSFGTQNFFGAGFWILVYGLMVYLPSCTVPQDEPTPRWWEYILAVIFPIILAIPVAFFIMSRFK